MFTFWLREDVLQGPLEGVSPETRDFFGALKWQRPKRLPFVPKKVPITFMISSSSISAPTHRLNMKVDLQSLFGLHVTWCAQLFSLAETPQLPPSPRIWTRITRALLVSKDRRHLFVTPAPTWGFRTCEGLAGQWPPRPGSGAYGHASAASSPSSHWTGSASQISHQVTMSRDQTSQDTWKLR